MIKKGRHIILFLFVALSPALAYCQDLSTTLDNINKGSEMENEYLRGVELYNDNKLDSAKTVLLNVVKNDPSNDAAYYYLALICQASPGRSSSGFSAAIEYLTKAREIAPGNLLYCKHLVEAYFKISRESEAEGLLEEILSAEPDNYRAMLSLYGIKFGKGEYQQAGAILSQIERLQVFSGYEVAEIKAELYREMNLDSLCVPYLFDTLALDHSVDFNKKAELIAGTFDDFPNSAKIKHFDKFGCALMAMAKECDYNHEAVTQVAIQVSSSDPKYSDNLLEICNAVAAKEDASKELQVEAHNTLAYYYYSIGDMPNTFAEYEKVLFYDPENIFALNNYAYFLSLENKHLDKALKMSAKTIEANPDEATFLDTYAWILHLKGNDKEAEKYFRRALTAGAINNAVILDHYADVLMGLKKYDVAIFYYKSALSKDKEGEVPDLKEKIARAEQTAKAEKEKVKKKK